MAVVIYLGEEKRVGRAHKEEVEEEGKCYENDVEMKGDDCAAAASRPQSECFTLPPVAKITSIA